MNKIIVYSTTTCPYCKMLKDYLSSKNVTYVEKLIDMDASAQEEMSKVSNGFLGVPFTVFTNENNKTETILGFDRGKIDKLLIANS